MLKEAVLLVQAIIEVSGVMERLLFMINEALLVIVLQTPLTSTEYNPAFVKVKLVNVSELIVCPANSPPSFLQT